MQLPVLQGKERWSVFPCWMQGMAVKSCIVFPRVGVDKPMPSLYLYLGQKLNLWDTRGWGKRGKEEKKGVCGIEKGLQVVEAEPIGAFRFGKDSEPMPRTH